MSSHDKQLSSAEALRSQFDRSFAEATYTTAQQYQELLAIRLAGDPYALRVHEVRALFAGRKTTLVPSDDADFLGVMSAHGNVVPVFGLASLLGYPSEAAPRWTLLCGGDAPVALAFGAFEAYLRVPESAVHGEVGPRSSRPHVHEVVTTDAGIRPVIGVSLLVTSLKKRIGPSRPSR